MGEGEERGDWIEGGGRGGMLLGASPLSGEKKKKFGSAEHIFAYFAL